MTLVGLGLVLIALAVATTPANAASVHGINPNWAPPLLIGGLTLAILGAVLKR